MGKSSEYTINDYRAYKAYFGLKTKDIALATGLAEQSIRNVTAKGYIARYGMPTWIVSAIFTWKMGLERQADLAARVNDLMKY